jgi:hypothetical protein
MFYSFSRSFADRGRYNIVVVILKILFVVLPREIQLCGSVTLKILFARFTEGDTTMWFSYSEDFV